MFFVYLELKITTSSSKPQGTDIVFTTLILVVRKAIFAIDPGMMDTAMQNVARYSDFELSEFFSRQKSEGKLSDPANVAAKIINLFNSPVKKNGGIICV